MMRKLFLSIAIASAFALNTGCSQFDLDLAPEDYFASGSFWKNADQVNGAMVGLHAQLRGYQNTFWHLGEIRGGTFRTGTGFTGTSTLNSQGLITQDIRESSPGYSSWANLYSAIFQVNNFIYQVESASYLADEQKGYFLGQAYGIRAFYYFHLYRTYGRVPIVTEPKVAISTPTSAEEAYTARSTTEKETLDFIKAEVDKSIQNFNNDFTIKSQKGQWSLAATQMLKSEVYLWSAKVSIDGQAPNNVNADLQQAKSAVETVIPRFTLQSNFANVFNSSSVPASKGNNEIIFAIRYQVGESTNGLFPAFIYAQTDNLNGFVDHDGNAVGNDPLQIASSGTLIRYEYKVDLYDTYDKADQRANATFLNLNKETNRAAVLRKYLGTFVNGVRTYADDYPVYRLAEAYLILAEIKNKLGEDPTAEIMMVRNRAYTGSAPQFVNGTFEQNELAIFYERSKEFVAEGKRWYDLRRMQDGAGTALVFRTDLPLLGVLQDIPGQNHKVLWPIDLGTLTADPKLQGNQNPGYEGT